MIDLPAIVIANLVGAVLMVILLTIYGAGNAQKTLDGRLLQVMIYITLGQCVVETATFLLDGRLFPFARPVCLGLNAYLYIANIFFAFLWTVYVDYKIYHSQARLWYTYVFLAIPAELVSALAVISLVRPILFDVSAENVYTRLPTATLAFVVTYGYLLYSMLLVNSSRHKINKYMFLPVVVFLLPIFAGSLLQMVFYGLSLTWISVSVAMVALYGCLKNEMAYIDPLSTLYNRRYLDEHIASMLRPRRKSWRRNRTTRTAGILADIDDFKTINDRFGHPTGDKAIRQAGLLLRRATRREDLVARYAGDEFVILLRVHSESELDMVARRIELECETFNTNFPAPYRLNFSMGRHMFDMEESPAEFLSRIDQLMYQEKRKKKAAPNV